ncbi:triokinase/FMN cyclase-like isoform X1 [Styela clava]
MSRTNRLLINNVETCVDEMLQAVVDGNLGQVLLEGHRVIVRNDIEKVKEAEQVTIICGGGSGHEPFAAGFVGKGMLSAAVAGSVFASPPPNDILAAIKAVKSKAGTLVIVANYTGDRLNFGIAVERAEALEIKVAVVVVGEDCALQSTDKTAGRRGLVGIVNVMKIAGALSEQGKSLEEIVKITTKASMNMGTIGVSLSACSVPGTGPSFDLPDTEMEVGLGAHGEAGVKRMKLLPADQTIEVLINHMTDVNSPSHLPLLQGDKVSMTMNNLGGLSELEMHVLSRKAIEYVESKGAKVIRFYFGHFMTSLDMAGFNLNITKLDDLLISCFDHETNAPAWPNLRTIDFERKSKAKMRLNEITEHSSVDKSKPKQINAEDDKVCEAVLSALERACHALMKNEQYLNELDTSAGDGDCGTTFKRGATMILSKISSMKQRSVSDIIHFIASCAEDSMGGASGGIYSLFFTAASRHLKEVSTLKSWCSALHAGINAVSKYGGAEPGDRTMLDALVAIEKSLLTNIESKDVNTVLTCAAKSATEAAHATVNMKARAGRASYVASEQLTKPDAGAMGVSIWMNAIANTL